MTLSLWLEVPGDLYESLGVDADATEPDIHRAWRLAAKDAHPDLGGDAEEFRTIHIAYLVLSDTAQRAEYDRYRLTQPARTQQYPLSHADDSSYPPDAFAAESSDLGSAAPSRSPYERPLLLWLMALAAVVAVVGSYVWPGFTIITGIAVGVIVLSRYHHMGFGLLRRR
jgi:curved DNA-binding protein CbpA